MSSLISWIASSQNFLPVNSAMTFWAFVWSDQKSGAAVLLWSFPTSLSSF
jgi:hypothetical protein